MAVPSSGQLRLRADINQEVNGNNTDTNVSLGTLADDAGFDTPPDTMQEFYGYTACGTPTGVEINLLYAATPDGFFIRGRYTGSNGGCDVNSYGFYLGTNSSSPTANTKYEIGTNNKGIYSHWDKTFTGLTASTTYYVWVYVSNVAGYTGYSSMGTRTTQAPYVPVTVVSTQKGSDFQYTYCPNGNFNGYIRPTWINSTTVMQIEVYGDGNFSHTNSSYPRCNYTFGSYSPQAASRVSNLSLRSSTCRTFVGQQPSAVCENYFSGYASYISSGYTNVITSVSAQCQAC